MTFVNVFISILFVLDASGVGNGSATRLKALYWDFPPFVMPANKGRAIGSGNSSLGSGNNNLSNSSSGTSSRSNATISPSIGTTGDPPAGLVNDILLGIFVSDCLPTGSKISEWKSELSPRSVHENRAAYDILFPVTRTSVMASLLQSSTLYRFVPFVESPGVSIVRDSSKGSSAIFLSVLGTWPLGLALVNTAIFAGILIWLLESRWNPDGFPRSFAKGLWEGVWWAWVTMSTVGYGDKTPMTIAGRVFAYIWILVGIIFMSIFTATVTTAISTDSSLKTSIDGQNVGVMNGSTEEWLALSRGAEVTVYDGQLAMLTALQNGALDAILMDSLRVISALTQMEVMNLVSVGMISAPAVHGVVLYNMSAEVAQCFNQIAENSQYEVYDTIKGVPRNFKKRSVQAETASMFVGDNMDWIYIMVGVVLGVMVLLLAGECIYRKYKRTDVKPLDD